MSDARLKKLIPLLGSDKQGEVLAAVGAIKRTLQAENMDFIDLSNQLTQPPGVPVEIFHEHTWLMDENTRLNIQIRTLQGQVRTLQEMIIFSKPPEKGLVVRAAKITGEVLFFVIWIAIVLRWFI